MKALKFNSNLVPLILSGIKITTWRLFDDKNLSLGDELNLINKDTGKSFTKAKIVDVKEKMVSEIDENDRLGHEEVGRGDALMKHYSTLYGREVGESDLIKIIKFELLK